MAKKQNIVAKNPVWANKEKTLINLQVNFPHLAEEYVEFTASPNDTEAHGREIFELAKSGTFGKVDPFKEAKPEVVNISTQ